MRRGELLLLVIFFVSFMLLKSAFAACDYDGICDSEENSYCFDCQKAFCNVGDTICDPGLGEDCQSCSSNCRICDGESCSSDGECEHYFCNCGVCASSRPSDFCCFVSECPSSYSDAWGSNYCKVGDVYHSRTTHTRTCSNQECGYVLGTEESLVAVLF